MLKYSLYNITEIIVTKLRRHLDFGRGRRHFMKAALNLLTLLPADRPIVTLDLFQQAVEMNVRKKKKHVTAAKSFSILERFFFGVLSLYWFLLFIGIF